MRVETTEKEKYILEHVKHILSLVFQTLLILFLAALLIRELKPDIINSLININWFMIAVIIVGGVSIIFPPQQIPKEEKITKRDYILILGLGILGGVILFYKLNHLGWIGYVITILGELIIIMLSWLILTEREDTEGQEIVVQHKKTKQETKNIQNKNIRDRLNNKEQAEFDTT